MKTEQIVRQEAVNLLRGIVPLGLITFAVFSFCGQFSLRTALSLLLGCCFSMVLFLMIGRSVAKAVLFPEAQGQKIVFRGYLLRYAVTGVFVLLAIKLPQLNTVAAIVPLFFPKVTLVIGSIFQKKGG